MLIKSDWTRRSILKAGAVLGTAGVLQPVLKLLESGKTIEAAYPEELLSIETYTKGKVKPGMVISKDNAELVKDICPEGLYIELTRGRKIKIKETTTDLTQFVDDIWIEATLRNKGQAVLDSNNQLWSKDHKPWIGGSPFPEPKNGTEMAWDHMFNVWRTDDMVWPAIVHDFHQGRHIRKGIQVFWQIQTTGRVLLDPKPYYPGFSDALYRQTLFISEPFDLFGLQLLTINWYDGTKLPEEIVYVPALRRLRRVASEARFEPAWPQGTAWPSEFTGHNDPVLTSTWSFAGKKPMLYPSPTNLGTYAPPGTTEEDFVYPVSATNPYPPSTWELRPEMWLVDGVSHVPGCPLSRKRLYTDAVVMRSSAQDSWDKSGKIWRSDCFFYSHYASPGWNGGKKTGTGGNSLWFGDLQADTYSNIWLRKDWEMSSSPARTNMGLKIEDICTPDALLRMAQR